MKHVISLALALIVGPAWAAGPQGAPDSPPAPASSPAQAARLGQPTPSQEACPGSPWACFGRLSIEARTRPDDSASARLEVEMLADGDVLLQLEEGPALRRMLVLVKDRRVLYEGHDPRGGQPNPFQAIDIALQAVVMSLHQSLPAGPPSVQESLKVNEFAFDAQRTGRMATRRLPDGGVAFQLSLSAREGLGSLYLEGVWRADKALAWPDRTVLTNWIDEDGRHWATLGELRAASRR